MQDSNMESIKFPKSLINEFAKQSQMRSVNKRHSFRIKLLVDEFPKANCRYQAVIYLKT